MGTQRRNTAQRTVLVDVLDRSTEFQSAQALHASLRSEGSAIGLATCGVTRELDAPEVERWASAVASDHGFVDIEHRIELFGLCPACAGRQDAEASPSG
jgi:Fur family ferric uptake transcriptional regulator